MWWQNAPLSQAGDHSASGMLLSWTASPSSAGPPVPWSKKDLGLPLILKVLSPPSLLRRLEIQVQATLSRATSCCSSQCSATERPRMELELLLPPLWGTRLAHCCCSLGNRRSLVNRCCLWWPNYRSMVHLHSRYLCPCRDSMDKVVAAALQSDAIVKEMVLYTILASRSPTIRAQSMVHFGGNNRGV